jgi:hypothetical protein
MGWATFWAILSQTHLVTLVDIHSPAKPTRWPKMQRHPKIIN